MRQSAPQRLRVVVFGATGKTGRLVVRQAAEAGHAVTAVARRASVEFESGDVAVAVVADLRDSGLVREVLASADVVISTLGPSARGAGNVCTESIRRVLPAMAGSDARLVAVSAYGASDTHDRSLYSRLLWLSVAEKMRDKESMEALIVSSSVDWTIVRPPALRDRPWTGEYRVSPDLKIGVRSAIGRADLADFVVREATQPRFTGLFPRIAN